MHIYKFTHIESGKCYIGQTIQDPNQRRLEHINHSKRSSREYHFHNALRKYGLDSFLFEVIDTANSLEELNLLEEFYVEKFDSINNGYNIRQPGNNKIHSEESKQRMREAQKAAHARRREENNGVEKHSSPRSHKGKTGLWISNKRGKESTKWKNKGSMSWKLINGKRVWFIKENDNSMVL